MKNDDNKCLGAGCTEYLSKPIDIPQLYAVLKRLMNSTEAIRRPLGAMEQLDAEMNALKLRFLSQLSSRMPELTEAIDNKRYVEFAAFGHWLKGTAGMVGADDLSELGEQLDLSGKKYAIEEARDIQAKIQQCIGHETVAQS